MTGRELDPEAYGEKDMSGLLVLLSHTGVLRMEYLGPGQLGLLVGLLVVVGLPCVAFRIY